MMTPLKNRLATAAAAAALSLVMASVAGAQSLTVVSDSILPPIEKLGEIELDSSIRQMVAQLDDPSFQVREETTVRMREMSDKTQLYAALVRETLSSEQRYRLLLVLRDDLVNTPRGALGISTDMMALQRPQNPDAPFGVRVADLIPGLPAERVLKIGDRITHIDGVPMVQMDDLQIHVQSKRPGERVKLSVLRAKTDDKGQVVLDANNEVVVESVELKLELGSADLLNSVRGPGVAPSRVLERRRDAAHNIAQRFAPPPKTIEIEGGVAGFKPADRGASSTFDELDDMIASMDVDQFPPLQELLQMHERIAAGNLTITPGMREHWNLQLSQLIDLAADPQLTEGKRIYLARVIQRYRQLLNR